MGYTMQRRYGIRGPSYLWQQLLSGKFSHWSCRDSGILHFKNQPELREHNLLEGLTTIPESWFTGCTGLVSLNIPAHIISIGKGSFKGCTSIRSINFSDAPERLTLGYSWMSFDSLTDPSGKMPDWFRPVCKC